MKKIRIVALILALCSLLSLTAWAEDAPAAEEPAEAETVEGPAWEIVSSGVKVWKDKAKVKRVHAWIEIKNTGDTPLYLASATLELLGKDDHHEQNLKAVNGFPQVLMPGEVGVYDEVTLADKDLPEKGLTVRSELPIKPAKVECIRYEVTGFKIKTNKAKQVLGSGKIVNGTEEVTSGILYVGAMCYNAKGKYIGLLWTALTDDINPGESLSFKTMPASWKVKAKDISKKTVYAFRQQLQLDL